MSSIQEQRQKRFQQMGLPTSAGQMTQGTSVGGAGGKNQNAYQALQDIKRGAQKNTFQKFVQAESSSGSADAGYQIPASKPQKRPGQPQEKSTQAVAPKTFGAKRSEEADSLEKLMYGEAGINMTSTMEGMGVPQGNMIQGDGYGPGFDPVAHLQQKLAQTSPQGIAEQKQNETYEPQQSPGNVTEMKQMIEMLLENQKPSYDIGVLKEMMEVVAKKVAESTMKKVINDFLIANNKKKNLYEVYNKEKNIVKIGEKLYQLTPVKVKNR